MQSCRRVVPVCTASGSVVPVCTASGSVVTKSGRRRVTREERLVNGLSQYKVYVSFFGVRHYLKDKREIASALRRGLKLHFE